MSDESAFGTGNVFADLGLGDPDGRLIKADIALRISSLVASRGMDASAAADLLDMTGDELSALERGRLNGFGMDRLVAALLRLEPPDE